MLLRWCLVLALVALAVSQREQEERTRPRFRPRFRASSETAKSSSRGGSRFRSRARSTTTSTTTSTTASTTTPPEKNEKGTLLVPPIPARCAVRPKHWKFGDNWYFYTADEKEFREFHDELEREVPKRYDWLDARNVCRKFCMDSLSIESEDEWEMIKGNVTERKMIYIWTSGRKCDFKGCETREDLKPLDVLGWFWSGTNVKLAPTNSTPPSWAEQPWSQTGHLKKPQPDNAEFTINETEEPCLGILNSIYNDGVSWHDIACYHKKPVICEDSQVLLNYARAVNERDGLGLTID